MQKLAIILPVFNDWVSFQQLLQKLNEQAADWGMSVDVIAVDDGSTSEPDADQVFKTFAAIDSVSVIELACNVGHQRAIAVGIAHAHERNIYDCIVVMDSDGEDRPEDIAELIATHRQSPNAIIAAKRAQRSEGPVFRFFYRIYKIAFFSLTGKEIDFGNFCLIPKIHISRLAYMAELWNHLAATIVRARVPLIKISTRRGHRYAGRSTMNFVSLIMHGLSAAAVFGDLLFVRLLVMSMIIMALSAGTATIVLGVRLYTAWAIPGWASTMIGLAATLLIQGLTLSATASFMTLNNRTNFPFIPALHALEYIRNIRRSNGDGA